MVYGLSSMVYGLWSMVDGLWSMVYGLWFKVYGFKVYVASINHKGNGFRPCSIHTCCFSKLSIFAARPVSIWAAWSRSFVRSSCSYDLAKTKSDQ